MKENGLDINNLDLVWCNLTVEAIDKNKEVHVLLNDCTGRALHSKITAVFGVTGSGKTTLVKALTGRLNPSLKTNGEVLIDDGIRKSGTWLHTIAFVDEEFAFQQFQTVYETIYFSLKMLKIDTDEEKIKDKTEEIIKTVGLQHNKHENIELLSEGEKKLLNIGVSLVEEPSILILDDPFGSLDFFNTKKLLNLFERLSKKNKSIVFTFKNPNERFVDFVDYFIILVNGTTIFEGTYEESKRHFLSCGFVNKENHRFLEFIYETVEAGEDDEQKCVVSMQNARKIKDKWIEIKRGEFNVSFPIEVEKMPKNDIRKMGEILKRLFITTWRNKELLYGLIIQKAVFFVAASLVYPRIGFEQEDIATRIGIVSFFILNATERSGTVIMSTFAEYRAVTIREIYSGIYSPTEAYWAKFIYNSVLGFVFSVIYIIPVYWISNVNNSFVRFVLFILNQFTLTNFIVAYSIVIGIYTRDHLQAHIMGSLLLMIFIVFSGIFVNINTISNYIRWVTWISPMYYAYESNLQVSMSNLQFKCDKESCFKTGKDVLKDLDIGKIHYFPALFIEWIFIALFILIGWWSYLRRYKPKTIAGTKSILNIIN